MRANGQSLQRCVSRLGGVTTSRFMSHFLVSREAAKPRRIALFVSLLLSGFNSGYAQACLPASLDNVRKFSDVIVEGTFLVDDASKGEGRVVAKRVIKGAQKRTYRVFWDANPEETFQWHELDCVLVRPADGDFRGFNLSKEKGGQYRIIGHWLRAEKHK